MVKHGAPRSAPQAISPSAHERRQSRDRSTRRTPHSPSLPSPRARTRGSLRCPRDPGTDLMKLPGCNRYSGEMLTGVGVRYDLGDDDPLVGTLVKDQLLTLTDGSEQSLYALMEKGGSLCISAMERSLPQNVQHARAAKTARRCSSVPTGALPGPTLHRSLSMTRARAGSELDQRTSRSRRRVSAYRPTRAAFHPSANATPWKPKRPRCLRSRRVVPRDRRELARQSPSRNPNR